MQHAWTRAVIWSAGLTVLFLTLLTAVSDLHPPVKQWLGDVFSHHWLGKGILGIAVFALLTLLCRTQTHRGGQDTALLRAISALAAISVLSSAALIVFYLIEWWK